MEWYWFCRLILVYSKYDWLSDLYQWLKTEKQDKGEWIVKVDYLYSAAVPIIKMETKADDFAIKVDITYKDEMHQGNNWVQLIKDYLQEHPILSDLTKLI